MSSYYLVSYFAQNSEFSVVPAVVVVSSSFSLSHAEVVVFWLYDQPTTNINGTGPAIHKKLIFCRSLKRYERVVHLSVYKQNHLLSLCLLYHQSKTTNGFTGPDIGVSWLWFSTSRESVQFQQTRWNNNSCSYRRHSR